MATPTHAPKQTDEKVAEKAKALDTSGRQQIGERNQLQVNAILGELDEQEQPRPGRLGWDRARFKDETGAGKSFRSEDWKNIVRAIDRYNVLDDEEVTTQQGIKQLGMIQQMCFRWLDRERSDERKAKRANRIAVIDQLACSDIPAEQHRVLERRKLDYNSINGGGKQKRDLGDNKVSVQDNNGLFRELLDDNANKAYGGVTEITTSQHEKLHVPAKLEDIDQRMAIVTTTCLEHDILNWKTATRAALEGKQSGTARIAAALVEAKLVDPKEVRTTRRSWTTSCSRAARIGATA